MSQLLRKRYQISGFPTDADLERILEGEGLVLFEDLPRRTGTREIYVDGALCLRPGLTRRWRRWCIAHGLMHHLCHRGDQTSGMSLHLIRRQEADADRGAGWLFWYHLSPLYRVNCDPVSIPELAEQAEVPVEMIQRWILVGESLRFELNLAPGQGLRLAVAN